MTRSRFLNYNHFPAKELIIYHAVKNIRSGGPCIVIYDAVCPKVRRATITACSATLEALHEVFHGYDPL